MAELFSRDESFRGHSNIFSDLIDHAHSATKNFRGCGCAFDLAFNYGDFLNAENARSPWPRCSVEGSESHDKAGRRRVIDEGSIPIFYGRVAMRERDEFRRKRL